MNQVPRRKKKDPGAPKLERKYSCKSCGARSVVQVEFVPSVQVEKRGGRFFCKDCQGIVEQTRSRASS